MPTLPRLILTLALLGAISGTARAEVLDRIAAVVNSDAITLDEVQQRAAPFMSEVEEVPAGPKREEARKDALQRALDDLIGEKLMDAELKGMDVGVTDAEVDAAIADVKKQNNLTDEGAFEAALAQQGFTDQRYHDFMKKQLAKVKLLNIKVKSKIKITEEDVKAEYARVAHQDKQDTEIHARHVLIQVAANASPEQVAAAKARAEEVVKLARGGADFAGLAKKYSQGPSAAEGGDLGWFARGTMVPEFENAAFALKKGEISEPVRTKFGFHVIEVEDTRKASASDYDKVKDQLRDKLYRAELDKQTSAYIAELKRNATIEVKIPELEAPK